MKKNRKKRILKRCLCFITAFVLGLGMMGASTTPAHAAKSYSDTVKISKKNPAVVIRVSYATSKFNEGWGGTIGAAPVKSAPGYELYDVVIWENKINLYKFKDVDKLGEGFDWNRPGESQEAAEKRYEKYWRKNREKYCLKSVSCSNPEAISAKSSERMRKAFISFFKIVKKRTPSKHIILKHSGHSGNLMLFNCMNEKDTKATLKKGMEVFGQKFALIDYGTNCWTSNTYVYNLYAPYTDYMIGSQVDYGGWAPDKGKFNAWSQADTDMNYHKMFKLGLKIPDAAKKIGKQNTKQWPYGKKNIRKNKVEQSVTVVNMKQYQSFMKTLKKKCGRRRADDVYQAVKKWGNSRLKKSYKKAVIYYKDNNNSTYFKWKQKRYGISFLGY